MDFLLSDEQRQLRTLLRDFGSLAAVRESRTRKQLVRMDRLRRLGALALARWT